MNSTLKSKLVAAALTTALVGFGSVAAADEQPDEQQQVEQADQADEAEEQEDQADEQPDEPADQADEPADEDAEQPDQAGDEESEEIDEQPDEQQDDEEIEQSDEDVVQQDEDIDDQAGEQDDAELAEEQAEAAEEAATAVADAEPEDEQEDPWDEVDPEQAEEEEQQVEQLAEADEDEEEDEPFSPTFGFGVDTGYFFTSLARVNDYILEPNDHDTFDVAGTQHIDLVAESEVIEHLRLSLLGGATFTWQTDPSLFGWYVGVEPAYVVGDDQWGVGLGASAAVGGLQLSADQDEASMSLVVLRAFVEGRYYFTENLLANARFGWNQWYPGAPESETLDLEAETRADQPLGTQDLQTGGPYLSVGMRFGALQGIADPDEEDLEPTQQDEDDNEE